MPITVTKPKQKVAPQVETVVDVKDLTLEDLADRYGDLEDKVNALMMNPLFQKFAEVKKELDARIKAELEPEDTAELTGAHWVVEVGVAAKNPRALKDGAIPTIQAMLGVETFGKIAKVNIGDCDKYLTPEQVEQVVDTDTGYSTKRKIVAKFLG